MVANSLLAGLLGALVGALVTYPLALRAARRQADRANKQAAYASMFPQIQESIDIMGEILAIEDLKLEAGEKAQGLLIRLMRPLWVLGVEDGILEVSGHLEDFQGKKPTAELLGNVRDTVGAWLLVEFYGLLRELKYDFAALQFTPPSPEAKASLDKVTNMMGGDEFVLGMRSLLRASGLSGMLKEVDLKTRAEAYRVALNELMSAMRADLAKS